MTPPRTSSILDTYTDGDYLDRPDAVQAYTALWNRLSAAAMGQVEARKLIIRLADKKKYDHEISRLQPRSVAEEH